MMKKLLIGLTALSLALSLCACDGLTNCKADGCEDEVYKDGYCEYHYTINALKEGVENVGKDLFNGIFGG